MSKIENSSLIPKSSYRNRRNVVRRILFFVFITTFIIFIYSLNLYLSSVFPELEIVNVNLVKDSFISNEVLRLIKNKNFFFISPRYLSSSLMDKNPLIKQAIIRKYFFPVFKIFVFIQEKSVWATIHNSNKSNIYNLVVTHDGCLVPVDFLLAQKLPKSLIPIFLSPNVPLQSSDLSLLNKSLNLLHKHIKLHVQKFVIDQDINLEIYITNGIKIKTGKIDNDLNKRLLKLELALSTLKQSQYLLEYIDLTLENSVVLKKHTNGFMINLLFNKEKRKA